MIFSVATDCENLEQQLISPPSSGLSAQFDVEPLGLVGVFPHSTHFQEKHFTCGFPSIFEIVIAVD